MTDTRPTFPAPGLPGPAAMSSAGDVDEDLDLDRTSAPSTPLTDLAAELAEELDAEVILEIPARAGYEVAYGLDIDHHLLGQWQKRAKDTTQPGQFDELRFACTVLAAKARRIIRNGAPVVLDGVEADFRTPAFHAALGVGRAIDAVRKVYGRDAHVVTAARSLLAAAGYSDDVMTADPTADSSTS